MIPWSLVDCANISKEHTASVFEAEAVRVRLALLQWNAISLSRQTETHDPQVPIGDVRFVILLLTPCALVTGRNTVSVICTFSPNISRMFCLQEGNYTYSGADKCLARPGRKQATATEDFEFHMSYL